MKRRIYQMYSRLSAKWDNYSDNDPAWLEWYIRTIKCNTCYLPGPIWHGNPTPIDFVIPRPLKHPSSLASVDSFPRLIRNDLLGVLRPHLRGAVVGVVRMRRGGELIPTNYFTIYTPMRAQLEAHRGENCRHDRCLGCGHIWNNVFWAAGGILERSLDDRLIYQDCLGWLYIDSRLADDLRLLELFPDLRFYKKFPVIKEPLDGDILPGDPGWDGTFRPRATAPFQPGEFGTAP